MKIKVNYQDKNYESKEAIIECKNTEYDIATEVSKILLDVFIPSRLVANDEDGLVKFNLQIKQRGSYIEEGITYPSMYVSGDIYISSVFDKGEDYQPKYLVCNHPESNSYKFYWLQPDNEKRLLQATYGRIGAVKGQLNVPKKLNNPYDLKWYWVRYYEKLSKGYKDATNVYLQNGKRPEPKTKIAEYGYDDTPSSQLYKLLQGYAKEVVDSVISGGFESITPKMVSKSRTIWKAMCQRKTVKGFNKQLRDLIMVCPRNVSITDHVLSQMAETKADFKEIINREESLISAMEAALKDESQNMSILSFDKKNIQVYEATDKQKCDVLRHLSDNLKSNVYKVYRVIPTEQQAKFDKYIKENKITTIKQFWHGSKNENWFSILTNGLLLNPNAEITGKMLGNGIYFAPSSLKSWNYTSYRGTYWAGGNSNTGIMGLYATAYGDPYDATNEISSKYNQSFLKNHGKNCVHARGGSGCYLRNDEVVYYNEDAMVLNYIVVFR